MECSQGQSDLKMSTRMQFAIGLPYLSTRAGWYQRWGTLNASNLLGVAARVTWYQNCERWFCMCARTQCFVVKGFFAFPRVPFFPLRILFPARLSLQGLERGLFWERLEIGMGQECVALAPHCWKSSKLTFHRVVKDLLLFLCEIRTYLPCSFWCYVLKICSCVFRCVKKVNYKHVDCILRHFFFIIIFWCSENRITNVTVSPQSLGICAHNFAIPVSQFCIKF